MPEPRWADQWNEDRTPRWGLGIAILATILVAFLVAIDHDEEPTAATSSRDGAVAEYRIVVDCFGPQSRAEHRRLAELIDEGDECTSADAFSRAIANETCTIFEMGDRVHLVQFHIRSGHLVDQGTVDRAGAGGPGSRTIGRETVERSDVRGRRNSARLDRRKMPSWRALRSV